VITGNQTTRAPSSEWQWEGDDPAEVYVVGHSHRAALVAAIRIPHLRPDVPVAILHGADEARQANDDGYWDTACELPRDRTLAIIWNGNQHIASFLFMPSPQFTLASVQDAPGAIVPEEAIRTFFRPTVVDLEQLLERIGDSLRVLVIGTPPPKCDAIVRGMMEREPTLNQVMAGSGLDAATAPLTHVKLRIALWRIVQDLLADIAAVHSAIFVPVPAEVFAEDGHLRDDLSAPDATHANELYGALMLRAIADTVVEVRAG